MSPETRANYETSIGMNLLVAGLLRMKQQPNAPEKEILESVQKNALSLGQLFNERMHSNYAITGQALSEDKLMNGDLSICKAVTEQAARQLQR